MIVRLKGKIIEKKELSVVIDVEGLGYEVLVPQSVLQRLDEAKDNNGYIHLYTYYYLQIGPASGQPILIGFINEIEKDFFLQFIKVSGIGPRAAVKALNQPISAITKAIDKGDVKYLKTLPGIGLQRAKEIVAKLQGKIGRFGLIQDRGANAGRSQPFHDWEDEALSVLLQLQYKRKEAESMIQKALKRQDTISNTEELLNEIYKQRLTP